VDRNMGIGATSSTDMKRRSTDIVGNNLPDPFFDGYREEMYTAYDIIKLADEAVTQKVTLIIDKDFLKNIVRSHINFIKEMEKTLTPNAH
jgi:hypothetical protein